MKDKSFYSLSLDTVLDAASLVSIIATDGDGIIRIFNSGAERLLGYKAEEVVGTCTPELFHLPHELEERSKARSIGAGKQLKGFDIFIDQCLHSGYPEQEWTFVTKNGEKKQVLLSITALPYDGDAITGFLGIATDITDRKSTERALQSQQRLMQMAIDNIPQFIFWKDTNLVYQGCNHNFAQAAGVASPEEIVGKTDYDLAWKREEAAFFRTCDRRVMNNRTPEYHIIEPQLQANGKQAWLDTNKVPMLDEDNNLVGILGTFEDITERLLAQEELQRSEENLRITLKAIGDGVIVTDISGRITRLNPVAEKLTGWSEKEACGRVLSEVFNIREKSTREPVPDSVAQVIDSDEIITLPRSTVLISRNNQEFDIADSGAPIRSKEGDVVGVVIVFRNITEDLKLQEQLNQSQKLDAIGKLASGVAHDFNNMLGGIIGSAELLRHHLSGDTVSERYLSLLLDSAQRAAGLANKLLAFSRQQTIRSTPIDIHQVIRDTVALLENTIDKKIQIDINLAASASMVVGDNSQLANVFLNLGINGAHAMSSGGALSFHTRLTELSKNYCAVSPFDLVPGAYVEVEVRDSGCGISQEIMDRIFDPFFTTKDVKEGTGLGLAAAYGTVKQHKGAITVYSEVGVGTSFHLYFPITEQEAELIADIEKPVRGEGLILLIDDEYIMRTTGEALLKEFGYDVLTAKNGEEGLELFKKHSSAISLVVLDMIMPVMNGRECFYAIRKLNPDARIVLSSGFSRNEDVYDLKEQGLAAFVQKPFRVEEFSRVIAHALGKSCMA